VLSVYHALATTFNNTLLSYTKETPIYTRRLAGLDHRSICQLGRHVLNGEVLKITKKLEGGDS